MNLSRVYHETVVNQGCSYSLNNGNLNPTNGYFVGGFVKSKVVHLEDFRFSHLQEFILNNSPLLSQDNAYLGTWIDAETNLVHIDVSILIDNLVNALDTASLYNEIAIYDNANDESIYLRNHMQYIEFRQSLVHLQSTIFIPCLNASIDKTAFISIDGYNSDLESQEIVNAYIRYIVR